MALEDRDIFKAICDRNPGQPIEFIMAQYEVARQLNKEIEKREAQETICADSQDIEIQTDTAEVDVPRKKFNRRSLKVKPQEAITDDAIICCLCGEKRKSLTATHLALHGISVEEYRKLCGYPPDLPLMSHKRHEEAKRIIGRAQQKRLNNKKGADN